MTKNHEGFTPDNVDEQVEQLLHDNAHRLPQPNPYREGAAALPPALAVVRGLRRFYSAQARADTRSLARGWERIASSQQHNNPGRGKVGQSQALVADSNERQSSMKSRPHLSQKRKWHGRLGLLAAVLFLALLVGSMALIFNNARQQGNSTQVTYKNKPTQTGTATRPQVVTPSGVYMGGLDGVYRLDVHSGNVIWHYVIHPDPKLPPAFQVSSVNTVPLVMGGNVYFGSQDGGVYALNAQNGKLLWSRSLTMFPVQVFITDDVLYVTASFDNAYVYALNPSNGAILHRYSVQLVSSDVGLNAAVAHNILYITSFYDMYALALPGGAQLWHKQISKTQILSAPQIIDGVIYVSSNEISHHSANESQDSYEYAFDTGTGAMLWQSIKVNGFILGQPAVVDGIVYAGSQNGLAYAFNASGGHLLWSRNTGGPIYPTPQAALSVAYVGETNNSGQGAIFALNAADGSIRWHKSLFSYFGHVPLVLHNGVLYVSTADGSIYALQASNGSQLWTVQIGNSPGFQERLISVVA